MFLRVDGERDSDALKKNKAHTLGEFWRQDPLAIVCNISQTSILQ